jgi:hypothetical protein
MFTIYVLSLNKLNTTIHPHIRFIIGSYTFIEIEQESKVKVGGSYQFLQVQTPCGKQEVKDIHYW